MNNSSTTLMNTFDYISSNEQEIFFKMRHFFANYPKPTGKDQRLDTFRNEIIACLHFIDLNKKNRSERSRLVGISFLGPYIIINTKILSFFLSRSKSSINLGLQKLGYAALKNKEKSKLCLITCIPSLSVDLSFMKQWSVRASTSESKFCFYSKFSSKNIPILSDNELTKEKDDEPISLQFLDSFDFDFDFPI